MHERWQSLPTPVCLPSCCENCLPLKNSVSSHKNAMVSPLFRTQSTPAQHAERLFTLGAAQPSGLSCCHSTSSALCFIAPEFPPAPEPVTAIRLLYSSWLVHLTLSMMLTCLCNSARPLGPSWSVTPHEKSSLLAFPPSAPIAHCARSLSSGIYQVVW